MLGKMREALLLVSGAILMLGTHTNAQGIYYQSNTGLLSYESWCGPNGWYWTAGNLGYSMAAGTTAAAVSRGAGTTDVYYQSNSGVLTEASWNGSSWSNGSLGLSMAAGTGPSALSRSAGTEDIYFQSSTHDLYEAFWNGSTWSSGGFGVSLAAGTSPAAISLTPTSEDVFYQGSNGHLWKQSWVSGSSWTATDLGYSMAPGTSPSVLSQSFNQEDVYFTGSNGNLWEAYWSSGSSWGAGDLGYALKAGTSPAAIALSPNGQNVFYQGTNGHLCEAIWVGGSPWTSTDLGYTMAAGTNPALVQPVPGSVQIYFQGSNAHLWEAYWSPGASWAGGDLGVSMAASTSPATILSSGIGPQYGPKPVIGWTNFDLQATTKAGYGASWANETNMQAQSNAMASKLGAAGYKYFLLDSGAIGYYDYYGRPVATNLFPSGIPAMANIVHKNGQKLGIYWIPGIGTDLYNSNPPIAGTSNHIDDIVAQPLQTGDAFGSWHLKVDFTKPAAQAYINSVVNLWASWGVDYIKLDGVSPGSDQSLSYCDDRPDVQAYWKAIQQCGRPMILTISWKINPGYIPTWQASSNARRIDDDVDTYSSTLTGWNQISWRFADAVGWAPYAGNSGYNNNYQQGSGWLDLDSANIGNGSMDGLTNDERKTVMTFWCIECSNLYLGDDLTTLDTYGTSLLTNSALLGIDQAGNVATQVTGGNQQVWCVNNHDGTYYVGLFNLGSGTSNVTVNFSSLGISGTKNVSDVWNNSSLGSGKTTYTAALNKHACTLIKLY